MSKRSLALIGAGKWGKNLARNFFEQGRLHTICDLNQVILESYRTLYPNVALEKDYQCILENDAIQQVVIATPINTHFALTKRALLAGKDVLVEKPLCTDIQQADELIILANQFQRILMVGHLLQYHPVIMYLQATIQSGIWGKLKTISTRRMNSLNHYQEEDVLWDLAPHDLSLILSLTSQGNTQKVECKHIAYNQNGIKDAISLRFQFEKEISADVTVGRLQSSKEQRLVLQFEKAELCFDDLQPWDKKLTISYPDRKTYHPIVESEPLKEECSHFLDCCLKRLKPKTDGNEGKQVVSALSRAEFSIDQTKTMRFAS